MKRTIDVWQSQKFTPLYLPPLTSYPHAADTTLTAYSYLVDLDWVVSYPLATPARELHQLPQCKAHDLIG
ncbi:hypothetical protein DSO57_1015462 [Entomophthora muscae]|uniref:Uncharacterized protein n=1 Tax=Entomophthora muscae TaxID=34485 RepID=A0ACC2SU93_9FUNG|nr:hypothetical protein DSO57_1015462 [Entomophthora muscae]